MFQFLYCIGEKKQSQQKIILECSFIAQNPIKTILELRKTGKFLEKTFWNFWNFFFKFEALNICNAKVFLIPLKWYSRESNELRSCFSLCSNHYKTRKLQFACRRGGLDPTLYKNSCRLKSWFHSLWKLVQVSKRSVYHQKCTRDCWKLNKFFSNWTKKSRLWST